MIFAPNHPLEGLKGADYNPRHIGEEELARLRHSLDRLGVAKPIIVARQTIVAGHQRTRSLRALGRTHAPAVLLTDITTTDEIRFNQLHNGTDFDAGDENASVGPAPDGAEPFAFHAAPYRAIVCNMRGKLATVRSEICRLMERYGNWGACVATMSGRVIHAAQYAVACRALGIDARVYRVPDDMEAEAAEMLGAAYGRFSYAHLDRRTYIQTYAQPKRLRERAKATKSGSRLNLPSYLYERMVIPSLKAGERILDFGCGQGDYAKELRRRGHTMFGIEFFFRDGHAIDTGMVHRMIDEAAADIEQNGLFDVVVCDSVVNSVDSAQAEADVMTYLGALCRPGGRVYFSSRARARVDKALRGSMQADQRRMIEFLDEDGFTAIYREGNWFYQKYHDEAEARALAAKFIGAPREYDATSNSWRVYATRDIELDPDSVRGAITREFDLMWPGGRSVGRADRMLAAWDRARNRPPRSASSGTS